MFIYRQKIDPLVAREMLSYDPLTGIITWKVRRAGYPANREAGFVMNAGYRSLGLCGKQHLAHRVAWAIYYGVDSEFQIDHINMNKLDNRICNLREATHGQNIAHRKIKRKYAYKGIAKSKKKWIAQINAFGKQTYLGSFATQEEAHAAYAAKAIELYGEFVCLD